MAKAKIRHTVIGSDGDMLCLYCKGKYKMQIPITIPMLAKKVDAFNVLHGDCIAPEVTPCECYLKLPQCTNMCEHMIKKIEGRQ